MTDYSKSGTCTADPADEKDCVYYIAQYCSGGCQNRSIVDGHCCSFPAYLEAEREGKNEKTTA